jgi:Phage major capsid protein E
MTQPTPGDVHVNMPLTNISIAYLQQAKNFIADQVFPSIPVEKQSDRYYTYDRGYFNRDEMAVRAPGSESKGGDFTVDNTPTYFAPVYAFHHDIDDQRRQNSDSVLQPDREATELCTHKALIRRERQWVTNYFGTGIWTSERAGVASAPSGTQFLRWDVGGSTPVEDIRAGITSVLSTTGYEPNVLVLGKAVYDKLIDHAEIVDRVKYNQVIGPAPSGVARVDTQALANLFGLDRVLVMKSIYNTAAEGQTNSHSFIGGKNALLAYAPPNPGLMVPSAGYTFSWTGYLGAGAAGQRIKRFRMEWLSSDRIEIEMAFDTKLISADLGAFFLNAIS